MTPDWQDADPTAYDPDNPLALLEKAAVAEESERAKAAYWAVRSMTEAGADPGVLSVVARDYVKRNLKALSLAAFDDLTRKTASDDGGDRDPNVATQLVEIAREFYTFAVSDTGEPFALPCDGPKVVSMLRGGKTSLRALLAHEFFTRTGRAASSSALADALLVLEGIAQGAEESRLYVRCAEHDGALWLDLGDLTGRAVRITAGGWSVEDEVPVLFKRTTLTGPLPEPETGGTIGDLWGWLNVAEDDRPLVAAELVARLFSEMPHVVLSILGEHGTAKTTTTKILVSLTDPSPVPVRKTPRDMEAWVTAAAGSWVVALDNLSVIPPWLSDSICRASTGDGDVRRKLYTDGDYAVFAFRRCVIFNGIDVGAVAGDLADRTLPITLHLIPDGQRKNEKAFWADWSADHPRLLGAVLDLAAKVLARLPGIKLEKMPRMADYALILAAVDKELGTSAYARYADQAVSLAADGLAGDPFAVCIQSTITSSYTGTSGGLLELVTPADPDWRAPKGWPKDARAVTGLMRRIAPAFRKIGWQVTDDGAANRAKVLHWTISAPAPAEESRDDPRLSPRPPQGATDQQQYELEAAGIGGDSAGVAGIGGDAAGKRPSSSPQPPQHISAGQDDAAGIAGIGGDESGTSLLAGEEEKPYRVSGWPEDSNGAAAQLSACPRHRTRFGAHPQCPDCQDLAMETT